MAIEVGLLVGIQFGALKLITKGEFVIFIILLHLDGEWVIDSILS